MNAVRPERQQEEGEGATEEREPEQLSWREPGVEQRLGAEADEDRGEKKAHPVEPDVGEVRQVAARQDAEDEPERDAADQHGRGRASCTPASCVTGIRA